MADSAGKSVAVHLESCRECGLHQLDVKSMRSGLRQMPVSQPPAMLQMRLKVLASRERSRALARRDFPAWLREKKSRFKLTFDHLLKPFAVPAAGGLLASFLCFGILVDNLQLHGGWDNSIPVGVFTEAAISDVSPFCEPGRDVLVQLTVDSSGHVTDYSLAQDHSSPEELREIGNLILYSTFTPATRFGQPVSSKRLVLMSHVSVKG